MSQICFEKHKSTYAFLFVYIVISLLVTGCEEKEPRFSDPNMMQFKRWARPSWRGNNERVGQALNAYKNKTTDPIPILIDAGLGQVIGFEEIRLYLSIVDEDNDILGFVIREESQDPNGAVTTLEEDYPFFAHHPGVYAVQAYAIDISVRKDESIKDEKAWNDYLSMDFDAQVKQLELPSSDSYISGSSKVREMWESSLPTIHVSVPDSDRMNVWIRVYDKAGNISNTVELVDRTVN